MILKTNSFGNSQIGLRSVSRSIVIGTWYSRSWSESRAESHSWELSREECWATKRSFNWNRNV